MALYFLFTILTGQYCIRESPLIQQEVCQERPSPDTDNDETKHPSTNADSSIDTKKILLVRQKLLKNFLALLFYTLQKQKFFFLYLRPPLSITFPQGVQKFKKFGHWTLRKGTKRRLNRVNK